MTVTLEQEEWNKVLAVLAQGPWTVVNPLILKIGEQMRQQAPTGNVQPEDVPSVLNRAKRQ